VNNVLRQGVEKGLSINQLMETWDYLQLQCALYINSEMPGVPQAFQNSGKPLRGFVQRLKGKQGRFRGNLSGAPHCMSAGVVFSLQRRKASRLQRSHGHLTRPQPAHRRGGRAGGCGQDSHLPRACVHVRHAPPAPRSSLISTLFGRHNIEKLRKRVKNGMNVHPGANFVLFKAGGKQYLKYGDRKRVSHELKYGDIVERHLEVRAGSPLCRWAADLCCLRMETWCSLTASPRCTRCLSWLTVRESCPGARCASTSASARPTTQTLTATR